MKDIRLLGRRCALKSLSLGSMTLASAGASTLLQACTQSPAAPAPSDSGPARGYSDGGRMPIDAGLGSDASAEGPSDAGSMAQDSAVQDAAVDCRATTPDATGPYFEGGAPRRTTLAGSDEPGTHVVIGGSIHRASRCETALPGYEIDLWQADAAGRYHNARTTDFRLRARITADADGRFSFATVLPGNYADAGGFRPAHIHFRVYRPDGSRVLTSQLYFAGDPYLGAADSCQPPTCFSNDPARILSLDSLGSNLTGNFPIYLDV